MAQPGMMPGTMDPLFMSGGMGGLSQAPDHPGFDSKNGCKARRTGLAQKADIALIRRLSVRHGSWDRERRPVKHVRCSA